MILDKIFWLVYGPERVGEVFLYFAHQEGSSVVKPRHQLKGALAVMNVAVLFVFGAELAYKLILPHIHVRDDHMVLANIAIIPFSLAVIAVYYFSRIRNLFWHCLFGGGFILAYVYLHFILPYLNCD